MLHKKIKTNLPNLNNYNKNKIIKIKEIITNNKNLPYYLKKENKYHTPKIYKSRNKFKLLDSNKTISTNLNTINNNNNYYNNNNKLFSLDEIYAYLYNNPIKENKKINTKKRILSSRPYFNNKNINNNISNNNILIYKKKDYFSKINEIKKKSININYKSPLIHNLYSDFLINKYNTIDFHIDSFKEKQIKINNIKHKKIKNNDNKKYNNEIYDDFKDINLKEKEILDTIKGFLGAKDNKLNQVKTKEDPLFEGIENKINYILDINILPNFKNNLVNINCDENICNNYIESGIQHYLSKVRVKYQREKDKVNYHKSKTIKNKNIDNNKEEKKINNNKINDENNLDDNDNNSDNLKTERDEENNNEINNKENKDNDNENDNDNDNDNEEEKNNEKNESSKNKDKDYKLTLYEYEDFFINKYIRYEKVNLNFDKCKKIVYKQVPKKIINININF